MKKFMNKLTSSGKLDAESFHDDEEGLTNYKKSSSLPADTKDAPEDIKVLKSMKKALSPNKPSSMDVDERDFKLRKSPSSGRKKDDKDRLNESDDKSLKKSSSLKNKISDAIKSADPTRSPALKGMISDYELADDDSDDSMENEVPRSGDEYPPDDSFLIRVPSGTVPFTPPSVIVARSTPPPSSSPSQHVPYSPHNSSPRGANSPRSATSPRSLGSPRKSPAMRGTPSPTPKPAVLLADDFDLRFGGDVRVAPKAEKDDGATVFFEKGNLDKQLDGDAPMSGDEEESGLVMTKSRSGLFSFGNKPRKLK